MRRLASPLRAAAARRQPQRALAAWRAEKLDGKAVADGVLAGVRRDVAKLQRDHGVTPGLAVIVVGERPDSLKYVKKKEDLAASLGLRSRKVALPAEASSADLRKAIEDCNRDDDVDGILVQLPLPEHLSAREALLAVDPAKDVDGFHPVNVGRLASWREATLAPCTPRGVVQMLKDANVPLVGAHVAVVGESNVVGQPLALMLLAERATVTVVHKHTPDPAALCREADVVVSAAGVARLVTAAWIKPGATVVDVGINFAPDPARGGAVRMCGDVAEDVWGVAARVSPVPGGVGPMTVAMLVRNTVDAALLRLKWLQLAPAAPATQEVAPPRRIWDGSIWSAADELGGAPADEELMEAAPPRRDRDCAPAQQNLWWLGDDGPVAGESTLDCLRRELPDVSEAKLLEMLTYADADGDAADSREKILAAIEAAQSRRGRALAAEP